MDKNFKDLKVWQRSRSLVKEVYLVCRKLPKTEDFALSSQMKRSSVSIPSNIAEGYRRRNDKEFKHFLRIASGSAAELETQLIIVEDIYKIGIAAIIEELEIIQKMLTKLSKSLA